MAIQKQPLDTESSNDELVTYVNPNQPPITTSTATTINPHDNQTQSPLLRLPSEIRNRIFSFALGGYKLGVSATSPLAAPIFVRKVDDHGFQSKSRSVPEVELLSLSQTCRQIYAETSLLPFKLNMFHSRSSLPLWTEPYFLRDWQREAIATLSVEDRNLRVWNLDLLPGLKKIIVLYPNDYGAPTKGKDVKDIVRRLGRIDLEIELVYSREYGNNRKSAMQWMFLWKAGRFLRIRWVKYPSLMYISLEPRQDGEWVVVERGRRERRS